ncbi:hypothetical protein D1164_20265 [Mariniphaga sediminis]|uniref:Uncharacterized protein n=1 Tax=Mariniphaga sediminis TaxID=1628158 RepID=A0A399CTV7_9BACT|nr:hypothetical protein D1164_20265 [Mariniphaga sediminis]
MRFFWLTRKIRWSNLFSDTFSIHIFMPYQADFTLCLDANSKQKSQGCVRFTRKNYVLPAKITETRRTSSNNSNFLTPSSLVFRLTDRGHHSDVLAINVYM